MFTLLITFMRCFHVSEPDARFPRRGNIGSRAVAGRTLLRNTGKRSHKWHDVYLIMWRPLTKLLPNTFPTIILKSGLKNNNRELALCAMLSAQPFLVSAALPVRFCCVASKASSWPSQGRPGCQVLKCKWSEAKIFPGKIFPGDKLRTTSLVPPDLRWGSGAL